MCLYPKLIINPKYKKNKKNGGNIPAVPDIRVQWVPIGCQNCIECRKKKAREWQVRMMEEIKENGNGKFITLTFSNENLKKLSEGIESTGYKLDNDIATKSVRLFLERWRKKHKKSLRHWLITELGHNGTENIHLHGIIWTNESYQEINEKWQYGYIWPRDKIDLSKCYVTTRTVNYLIKYITKIDKDHPNYKSIILCSPGIGNAWMKNQYGDWNKNEFKGINTDETYRTEQGWKIALPIYYRNKIYTEEERERLWLHKLDQECRYVNGIKIKINKSDAEYIQALKYAQKLNKELGYGDAKQNWKQAEYEHNRRIMLQKERMNTKQGRRP